MNWTPLTSIEQLDAIDQASHTGPVLIFKHSTRCSISSAAMGRLERGWSASDDERPTYFLDLLKHRSISDAIATRYNVEHESPQTLVIVNGKCVSANAHFGITYADTIDSLDRAKVS